MSDDAPVTKEELVENGMDIVRAIPGISERMLLESAIGFTHTAMVHYLNNNGHALAAQALDDLWYPRDEQWHREPDGFDGHYKNGEEKRREVFGNE